MKNRIVVILTLSALVLFSLNKIFPLFHIPESSWILFITTGFLYPILIFSSFVVNLKKGSNFVGMILILMGTVDVIQGAYWLDQWNMELAAHADDLRFQNNFSAQIYLHSGIILLGLAELSMGIFLILKEKKIKCEKIRK